MKLNGKTKYYQVSKQIQEFDQQRFMAINEKDREDIFQDYMDDLILREREQILQRSRDNIKAIK